MDFQCERNRNTGIVSALKWVFLCQKFSFFKKYSHHEAKCVFAWYSCFIGQAVKFVIIFTCRFSVRFHVTHFKFPGDYNPVSPSKETAWEPYSEHTWLFSYTMRSSNEEFSTECETEKHAYDRTKSLWYVCMTFWNKWENFILFNFYWNLI